MATPTRSQVASTPKHVNTTPSRSNASPRTNLGAFGNKTVAGKSPAVKTPASVYGHTHKMSISSHPTSTPLATSTLQEDIMNINTPALLAMGAAGLTPLPSSVDGLGIATGGLSLPGPQDVHPSKNPERERHERLKEVEDVFRSRTAGRGITRNHIERLASINRFDTGFDEGVLSIAGQRRVDLEIVFDSRTEDAVKNVSLKLNLPDQDDAVFQDDASRVLTNNLTSAMSDQFPWHDLSDFSANLAYLSRLEHVNTDTNCFQVMDNLHDMFRQIWTEEKKRMKWRHDLHHLCKSNIGQPLKDANGRLGVSTNFWTKGSRFYARETPGEESDDKLQQDCWAASFAIETGPPAMSASQKWLGEDILTSTVRAEDIFQESAVDKPSWQDAVSKDLPVQNGDPMKLNQPGVTPAETVNMHLTCNIYPEILLPLHVAQAMNEPSQMVHLYHHQLSTFQQALCAAPDEAASSPQRWTRSHYVPDFQNEFKEQKHSYALYTTGPNLVHPVSKLNFAHPRQYSEALPALRQYALVNTLLRSLKPEGNTQAATATDSTNTKPIPIRGKIVKRSNRPQLDKDVKALLGTSDTPKDSPLTVDVRIDSASSPIKSCRIEIRVPLLSETLSRTTAAHHKAKHFMVIHVDVLLNGVVEIISLDGVDVDKQRLEELKKRLAKVVRASEDIGIIVAWTLRELQNS